MLEQLKYDDQGRKCIVDLSDQWYLMNNALNDEQFLCLVEVEN